MAAVADSPRRFIRVKRKASEAQDNIDSKKFKFLGSSKKGDDQTVKELIVTKTPSLAVFDEDLMIMDFEDFIAEGKEQQFPKKKEGNHLHLSIKGLISNHISLSCTFIPQLLRVTEFH